MPDLGGGSFTVTVGTLEAADDEAAPGEKELVLGRFEALATSSGCTTTRLGVEKVHSLPPLLHLKHGLWPSQRTLL